MYSKSYVFVEFSDVGALYIYKRESFDANINLNDIGLYLRNPNINWWAALVGGAVAEKLGATASYEMAFAALAADAGYRLMRRTIPGGHNLSEASKDFAYAYEAIRQLEV